MLSVIVHVLSTSREAASPLQPRGRDGVPKPSTGGCEGREAEGAEVHVYSCVVVCAGGSPSPDVPQPRPHLCTRKGPSAPKFPLCLPRCG